MGRSGRHGMMHLTSILLGSSRVRMVVRVVGLVLLEKFALLVHTDLIVVRVVRWVGVSPLLIVCMVSTRCTLWCRGLGLGLGGKVSIWLVLFPLVGLLSLLRK